MRSIWVPDIQGVFIMTTKIILADDEERWRMIVRDFLENEGYEILEASDGQQAVRLLHENPDTRLVILDIMMPGLDGISACRELRTFSDVPVIIVTAAGDETTEVAGFNCGADDFVAKPIKLQPFMARVKAMLKRTGESAETVSVGPVELDLNAKSAMLNGSPLSLTPTEYDLLCYFVSNPHKALSREQILRAVWNTEYYGDGRTVDTHVKNLRMKLGAYGSIIRTVRSRGYILDPNHEA